MGDFGRGGRSWGVLNGENKDEHIPTLLRWIFKGHDVLFVDFAILICLAIISAIFPFHIYHRNNVFFIVLIIIRFSSIMVLPLVSLILNVFLPKVNIGVLMPIIKVLELTELMFSQTHAFNELSKGEDWSYSC